MCSSLGSEAWHDTFVWTFRDLPLGLLLPSETLHQILQYTAAILTSSLAAQAS